MDNFQPSRITSRIAPDDDGHARTLRGIHLNWSTVRACCARCSVRNQNERSDRRPIADGIASTAPAHALQVLGRVLTNA